MEGKKREKMGIKGRRGKKRRKEKEGSIIRITSVVLRLCDRHALEFIYQILRFFQ